MFNMILAMSMMTYSIAFLPIIISASILPTRGDSTSSIVMKESLIFNLSLMQQVLLGFSSFSYLMCAQIQFIQLRKLLDFPAVLNTIILLLSFLLFVIFSLVIYVIMPLSGNLRSIDIQQQYGNVWVIFVFVVLNAIILFSDSRIGSKFGHGLIKRQHTFEVVGTSWILVGLTFLRSGNSGDHRALSIIYANMTFSVVAGFLWAYTDWLYDIQAFINGVPVQDMEPDTTTHLKSVVENNEVTLPVDEPAVGNFKSV